MSKLDRKLTEDTWSVRAIRAFDVLGLKTYGDLCARQASEFRILNNFGNKSFHEIEANLTAMGLKFATAPVLPGLTDEPNPVADTPSHRHADSFSPPVVPPSTDAPPSLRYKFAGDGFRVDKFRELTLEFSFANWNEATMEFFHATISPYSRQWQIVQRLYGITPLLLPEGANVEDYRPLTHMELGELMGVTLPQLQQELSAVRVLWSNAVATEERRIGDPANRSYARESVGQHPESAHALTSVATPPPMTREEEDTVLAHYGFDRQIFELPSRSAEFNAWERGWFLKRLMEWQKEMDEPKASGIAREVLLGELYMRRIDRQVQTLDPMKSSYAKDFTASMDLKNEIQRNYLLQLTELDNLFPYKNLIGGKVSFKGVISETIDAVRDYYSRGENALVNKIYTAGEVEILMRQSVQAPEARWRLGKDVFILEAIHPSNIHDPNYKSQYSHRMLKKLDLISKRLPEEVRRETGEELVDLEKDTEEGEYHELRENQSEVGQ